MASRTRAVVTWELAGAVFMILAGSALHFVFDWAGGWRPLALVAAVNESIWEHLKLAFWPGLLWALLPHRSLGLRLGERLAIKGVTLLLTAVLIVAVFQSYTAILGKNLLVLDIGTFVLAILAGQLLAILLILRGAPSRGLLRLGQLLMLLQVIAYASLTYLPPDHWLFIEERSGMRGIAY